MTSTVVKTTSTTTLSNITPTVGPVGSNFTAKASVTGFGTPTGTVTFSLYASATCTSPSSYSQSGFTLSGGAATGTLTPMIAGTYYWQAVYSGDTNNLPSTSTCSTTSITVNATGATSLLEYTSTSPPATSPSPLTTTNGAAYLILVYAQQGSAASSTNFTVSTGSGTPFSSASATTVQDITSKTFVAVIPVIGNGTSTNDVVVSGNHSPTFMTVQVIQLIPNAASIAATNSNPASATSTSPATVTLSTATAGDGEIALIAETGSSTTAFSAPTGMTPLGSQQQGTTGSGYTVDAYFDAQAITSASFPFTNAGTDWGTIAAEVAP